jgi:F-type H+-transporting ATPase subunit b
MSALPSIVEHPAPGHTEVAGDAEPTLLGLGAEGWVYVSITLFFLAAIVYRAPGKILAALDAQIAQKRADLDEAARIRAEAQALLEQAKAQQAQSAADSAEMLEHARAEAAHILDQAEADAAALIARRGAMAETKIEAAERAAIEGLRRETAEIATAAARQLITRKHGEAADRQLVDEIIAAV